MLAEKYADRIASIRAKYPDLRSTVMPLLYIAQEEYGGLNDGALREVAHLCDLDPTEVKTIAGFYTMYWEEGRQAQRGYGFKGDGKKGKYWLQVCTDLPCALRGADQFYAQLKDYLGLADGGTTEDGLFTVEHAIVSHHLGHPEPVLSEHPRSSFGLCNAVRFELPPCLHRRFITPKGEREYFAGFAKTFKAFNGNKSINFIE